MNTVLLAAQGVKRGLGCPFNNFSFIEFCSLSIVLVAVALFVVVLSVVVF